MPTIEVLSREVDDATAVYILETQKCFEDLKQVAAQIELRAKVKSLANVMSQKDEAERIRFGQRHYFRQEQRQCGADRETPQQRRQHEADISERGGGLSHVEFEAHFQQATCHENGNRDAEQRLEHLGHVHPFNPQVES